MSDHANGRAAGEKKTLIEEGTEFKGTLSSKCPIVVMGRIEGEVAGPSLEVTGSGVVSGKVKVDELRSEGELAGEIDATSVRLSGVVRDRTTIRAKALEVSVARADGKMEVTFGDCELAVGEAPDKAAAIAAATAPVASGAGAGAGARDGDGAGGGESVVAA